MSSKSKLYFSAGPAKIPKEIMEQIHKELLDYGEMGISVLEMSHRSKEFEAIIKEAELNLRKLLKVPENYSILFMHGGARSQFDSAPMNLCSEPDKHSLDYIVTGSWSKIAAKEALKYAKVVTQLPNGDTFDRIPSKDKLQKQEGATFRFYCDNETIQGVEFNYVPECDSNTPLVCDMTSNFLSRPVDVSKFGVIFAGAQKNCGIAGLAIVIVRNDLFGRHMRFTPTLQTYKIIQEGMSLVNTPLTFAIYISNLCFKWMLNRGGLEAMDSYSKKKAAILYNVIDNSGGFYTCPVAKESRSRMNIVFLLKEKTLDSKFLAEAKEANLYDIKGHRSVGGFRASLYHGVSVEDTKRLAEFIDDFRIKHSS